MAPWRLTDQTRGSLVLLALRSLMLCAVLGAWSLPRPVHAEPDVAEARGTANETSATVYARVIVEKAALRTGPGATFRLVRTADQGETFPVRERAPRGFWLRVELPDGSSAYVQGDAVYTHAVGVRSRRERVLGKLFAPPPLLAAHGEVSISLGALSQSGFMAVRPCWLLGPSFGFEATLGAAVGSTGRIFLGSLGGIINLFPSWPVVPFVVAGGGGLYASPNADSFVLEEGTRSLLYGGGGLRFGFRRRIILRVEARGYAFFEADQLLAQQEISGGFSAFF
jgi:hypothetical protein